MAEFRNSLDGISSGTGVTTGNSGGASGQAFSAVTLGAGATATADNVHAAHGPVGLKLATGGSAADCCVETTSLGTTTTVYMRAYYWIGSNPGTNHRLFDLVALPNLCGAIYLTTTGKVQAVDTGGGQMGITTTSVALNQWIRIECKYVASATVGQAEVRLFNEADSTYPTEVVRTAASFNTQANFSLYRFGAAGDPLPANRTIWADELALSTADFIGPVNVDPTPTWAPGFMAANGFPSFLLSVPQERWPAASPYDTGEVVATGANAPAADAAGTGTANAPSPSIAPTSSVSTGTGTANSPQPAVSPSAGSAAGSGAANATTSLVSPTPGTANATGAAQAPSPSIQVNPGVATATGTAFNPTVTTGSVTSAPAGLASGAGTANNASAIVAPGSGAATATGAAQPATCKVSPTPTTATATGTAFNPTVVTGAVTNANAGVATATGTANGATGKVAPTPQTATAVGAISATALSVRANAQAAAALATANTPTITGLVFTPGTAHAASMTAPTASAGSSAAPTAAAASGSGPGAHSAASSAPSALAATSTAPTATGG